jgi:hypothetical protein
MLPDHSLRKRKFRELDLQNEVYVPTGKESLMDMADRLKSTNNNRNI